MTVYAAYCPDRKKYVGSYFYISDTPKLYWTREAAETKAKKMMKKFSERCEVVAFELVEKAL